MSRAAVKVTSAFYWDHYSDTPMGRYLHEREYAFIVRFLPGSDQGRPRLDAGCGSGRLTRPLRQAGFDLIGLDVDPVALAAFRRRSDANPLVEGDLVRLPFATATVGAVIAIQCFEYSHYQMALAEFSRILVDNGLLIFDALNRRSYKWWLKRLLRRSLRLPSANLSYLEIRAALIKHGFQINAVTGYNWAPFTRESHSIWVQPATWLERILRLDRFYSISPKILVSARRRNSITP